MLQKQIERLEAIRHQEAAAVRREEQAQLAEHQQNYKKTLLYVMIFSFGFFIKRSRIPVIY